MQDEALKFEAIVKEIELAIKHISELGFDISLYVEALKKIRNDVNNDVREHAVKNFEMASYAASYSKGITSLNKLKIEIEKYDGYVRIYNSCLYIEEAITEDISMEELSEYVSKMIGNLRQLSISSTIDFENEQKVVDKAYEVAYKLIKLEIAMTGNSKLYLNIKNYDPNIKYLSPLIMSDLDKIKQTKELRKKLYKIKENGIYSDMVDIDLIKFILLNDKQFDLKNLATSKVEEIAKDTEKNNKEITNLYRNVLSQLDNVLVDEKEVNHYRKKIAKRSTILGIVTALFLTGGGTIWNWDKKANYGPTFEKTTKTYSSVVDDEISEEKYKVYLDVSNKDKDVILYLYEEAKNNKRNYLKYDISNYDFDNPQEYFNYGIGNYSVFPEKMVQETDKSGLTDSYMKLEISTYEYIGEELDIPNFIFSVALSYIAYIMVLLLLLLGVDCFTNEAISDFFVYDDRFKDLLDNLKSEKYEYNSDISGLRKYVSDLYEKISQSDFLKAKFAELYEQNKYLLKDKKELCDKIQKLLRDNENISVLIDESETIKKYTRKK